MVAQIDNTARLTHELLQAPLLVFSCGSALAFQQELVASVFYGE